MYTCNKMTEIYKSCRLCPRNCGVNRLAGETGFCGETAGLRVGAAVIHRGEEPPLVGTSGSGTIFICGCNLGCVFCQNYQISQGADGADTGMPESGKPVSPSGFAGICAALRDNGAENINIVTGSHAVPGIIDGLTAAREAGVRLPVLWNSSAYETDGALLLLKDHVDIYLPDLKTLDSGIAEKFFNAPDYPSVAAPAVLKMIEMALGRPNGRVIVRHLILPEYIESTRSVLRWFADNAKQSALLSLMTQYTPIPLRGKTAPRRFLSEEEYETVLGWLDDYGIEEGFCQELVTGSEWLPDFTRANPFSSELSTPIFSALV